MLNRIKQTSIALAGMAAGMSTAASAAGLDLAAKTNTLVTTMDTLGLPVLILAICVGVMGYWFKAVSLGFAGAIIIGGIIFGAAPEIATYLLA